MFVTLVQVTLQVANGDREKADKMLEDPDALMANEEVQRIIAAGAAESGDIEVVEGVCPEGRNGEAAKRAGNDGRINAAAPRGERARGVIVAENRASSYSE